MFSEGRILNCSEDCKLPFSNNGSAKCTNLLIEEMSGTKFLMNSPAGSDKADYGSVGASIAVHAIQLCSHRAGLTQIVL
ncbi:putative protein phosphatase 2C 35 [Zea mays]|uniref:Uncharacterized protein n=1 Tax=Zea mays TaxID=4577 RepID=A0A1D6ILB5_MAIZE|nr:putative protein phosphatase 2C 35 [Zea mays]